MLCAKQPIFALLFVCHVVGGAAAQEKPFNQEEWQRGVDEISNPKPADPKLEAIAKAKRLKVTACLNKFIEKNATAASDEDKLTKQACRVCDRDIVAAGVANYNASLITTPLTAKKDHSIQWSRDSCPMEAWDKVFLKQSAIRTAQRADLKAQYAVKIAPAMNCSTQAAKIYALTTSDSAESVATASFEKCHDLWGEAAEFALNLFPDLSEFDRWDDLKKVWMDHGISTAIDERARQKLGQPPPAEVTAPETKQGGTGI